MSRWLRRRPQVVVYLLVVAFTLVLLAPRILVLVEAGEGAVLFRRFFGGVVTTRVYGEGIHFIFPWDKMAVYTVRIQQLPISFTVLSENGLQLKIQGSVRYRPLYDALPLLHREIGPDYVERVLVPVVESGLREACGRYRADEIYASRGPVISEVNGLVARELNKNFIALEEVVIKEVFLPEFIKDAVEKKELYREQLESYDYRLRLEREEAVRKEIEAFGWRNYNTIVGRSLNERLLQWKGIQATEALATSSNSKVVIVGGGKSDLPVILGEDYSRGGPSDPEQVDLEQVPSEVSTLEDLANRVLSVRSGIEKLLKP